MIVALEVGYGMASKLSEIHKQIDREWLNADSHSVAYPTRIDLDWFDLPNTWYGRYGNSVSVTFFIWPILWTDGYRGK